MGNIISFDGTVSENDDSLSMSNGLTDVFIDYLLLSGSQLAQSESEKRIVVFLAEKQQIKVGIGNVDFDIIEMPWERDSFETDKAFILKMIHHAKNLLSEQSSWNLLGYEPEQKYSQYALNGFETLIKRMTINNIDEINLMKWLAAAKSNDPINCGFPRCPKHGVLLSVFGCKFCNDRI